MFVTAPKLSRVTAVCVTVLLRLVYVTVNASTAYHVELTLVAVRTPKVPSGHFTVAFVDMPLLSRMMTVGSKDSPETISIRRWSLIRFVNPAPLPLCVPVKVPEPLLALFPKGGRPLGKADGEAIRRWNETGHAQAEHEQLTKRARMAADDGLAAYQEFFGGLAP